MQTKRASLLVASSLLVLTACGGGGSDSGGGNETSVVFEIGQYIGIQTLNLTANGETSPGATEYFLIHK